MEEFSHYKPQSSRFPLCERRKFDVFVSFRGPDVRKSLADHLYQSLSTAGLRVFLDNEELEKGKAIGMSLQQAIQNSTIYIPIFSPNYASSKWCLTEVDLMWTLKSQGGHLMIPLFYNVEPSDVRYGGGPYAEAFNKHLDKYGCPRDVIQRWRDVLRQVSCLSGWSLEETASGYEGKLVSQVVKDVLQSLDFGMVEVAQHSVGLEPRSHEVRQLLKLGDEITCDKLTLGIWGMPGLGKTNLSKAIYNEIRHLFPASSFVSDVNPEDAEDSRHGIMKLQRQILKDLLRTDMKLNDVDHGKTVMRSRLASIKALVVLDDVHNEWQLDALQGDWFGKGSRIIITTRDKRVLEVRQVNVIYPMSKLEDGEAVELFSWHAFHGAHPKRDYEDMTERIVKSCSGLPLSLKMIGTDLYNRDKTRYWPEVLNKLENVGNDAVFETLKISYNNLSDVEKHIFLDIACFFVDIKSSDFSQNRAFSKDFYVRFWSVFGCETVFTSLKILEEKSFIVIDEQRYNEAMDDGLDCLGDCQYFWEFSMYHQIRDMGRRVVREESWKDPTKRSRVWREEDIRTLMAASTAQGNEYVEGLMCRRRMEFQSLETLASLQKLDFLLWWEMQVKTKIKILPTNIKYLVLSECRLEMARTESCCEQILDIIRRWISQAKVKIERTLSSYQSKQHDPQMMTSNSSSSGVNEFPVFSHFLPKSIAQLVYLKYLDMSGTKQSCLPIEICKLQSLEEIYLSRCGLKALPEAFGSLINLRSLDVSDNFLSEFPPNFDHLVSLVNLQMARNKQLVLFPTLPVNLIVVNARGCSKMQPIFRPEMPKILYCSLSYIADLLPPDRRLKYLHMLGCDITGLNMFKLLEDFRHLEQLDLSLSSQVPNELQPLIGQKNLTLHSFSSDSRLVAFFFFDTESEETDRLPQMDVLMTYLDDVRGSLISKAFEVPSCMKGENRGRLIMRVCIWEIKSIIERGMASCSYSVRDPSGSQVFLRQVEFLVLKEKATSQSATQFLQQGNDIYSWPIGC